ncbi:MAG TPA: ABC transporter permease [Anaerolineales bacterium]|nr:ABC transporter permease [Anaerolineales bacterium]
MIQTLRRIWSLSVKEFLHLRNDWWLPAFMLLGGAMELVLVGWATSRPITNLPLMVLDHDRSQESRRFIIDLENTGTFTLEPLVTNVETIEDALLRGDINAAVIIPPDFSTDYSSATNQPTLAVILNGAESIPAVTAQRAIEGVAQAWGDRLAVRRIGLDPDALEGFFPSLRVWFNEALNAALYTTPAELGLMLEFTVLIFAALSFSRERELGTLEQLLVMPFSSLEIIIGKAIPVMIIGLLDFALMLGLTNLFFGVPVRGSLALLFLLALGYVTVELSKGLVISVIVRTQHQAFLLVMLIGMVDFMFTGYAAPVESMPKVVQLFANVIPAYHWLAIVRGILLKASGMEVLWPHVLALAGIGLVIVTFSIRFVRRTLK